MHLPTEQKPLRPISSEPRLSILSHKTQHLKCVNLTLLQGLIVNPSQSDRKILSSADFLPNTWTSFFWTETILFQRPSAREFSLPNTILTSVLSPQSSWRHPLTLHAFLSVLPCCVIDITSDTAFAFLLPSTAVFIFSWFFTYFTKSFDEKLCSFPSVTNKILSLNSSVYLSFCNCF